MDEVLDSSGPFKRLGNAQIEGVVVALWNPVVFYMEQLIDTLFMSGNHVAAIDSRFRIGLLHSFRSSLKRDSGVACNEQIRPACVFPTSSQIIRWGSGPTRLSDGEFKIAPP